MATLASPGLFSLLGAVAGVWIPGAGATEFNGRDLGPLDKNVKHETERSGFPVYPSCVTLNKPLTLSEP